MNRQQFSELVKDPRALAAESIPELENLIKQYPYCQTAQILFTLNLLQQNHASYQAQLKKAVAYAGDRKKLKDLLEGKKQAPVSDTEQFIQEEPAASGEADDSVMPQNIPVEPKQENFIEESLISSEELALASPQAFIPDVESHGFVSFQPVMNKQSDVPKQKVSQDDLLSIVRKRLAEINEEKSRKESKKEPLFQKRDTSIGEPVLRPAAEFNKSKNELIDTFIREEPQISKPKKEFFTPAASSYRSNMNDEDIVSETLALLYAKQGNMQKAIHIYEKLSLRFSEKSRYFAAQIDNIKGNRPQI